MNNHTDAPDVREAVNTDNGEQSKLEGLFASLCPEIQRALIAEGYESPTPIQEKCIPHLLDGRDLFGCAQTGTGKTAAFSLPLLQKLAEEPEKSKPGKPRALILAPTRELASQIGESLETYGRYMHLRHTVIYGGVKQHRQVKMLNKGVHILVATPGRLLDLMEQGHVNLSQVEVFILDEVDRMLDMGFIPDIKRVLKEIPQKRQTLFFSATMAPKVMAIAETMFKDPVRITITPDAPAVDRIDQKILFVGKGKKNALLLKLFKDSKIDKAIVFTQMKHVANRVVQTLNDAGVRATAIHGNKSQGARTKALEGFRKNRFQVLVATDVAARGLDVDDITHVINYDLPVESETYIHRIGRTGRAGADGDALSFCSAEERAYLTAIENLLGESVPVDFDHGYHCPQAENSRMPAPKQGGGGGRRGGGQGQGRNQNRRRGNAKSFNKGRSYKGQGGKRRQKTG